MGPEFEQEFATFSASGEVLLAKNANYVQIKLLTAHVERFNGLMVRNRRQTTSLQQLDMNDLPLIRLNSARILVAVLDSMSLDTDAVLEGVGLTRAAFENEEAFIPAIVMYQLCEDAAGAADDRSLLAFLGERVNTATWPPIAAASAKAQDIGQLFTHFAIEAIMHSSATVQALEIHGDKAVFMGRRSFTPTIVPAQIDAFFASLLVSILRRAMGRKWRSEEVTVTVSDPEALPTIFYGVKPLKGDRLGYRIAFPALWLMEPFVRADFEARSIAETEKKPPSRNSAAAVSQALAPYIGHGTLSAKAAAALCGKSERTLRRILEKEGTSLAHTLATLKRDYAIQQLLETECSIVQVSESLGYKDAASFARAFNRWVGQSPNEYRRSQKRRES